MHHLGACLSLVHLWGYHQQRLGSQSLAALQNYFSPYTAKSKKILVFFFWLLTEAIIKSIFASSYHRYSLLLIKPLSYCGLLIFHSQVEIRFFIPGGKWVLQHLLFCPDAGWNIHVSTRESLNKLFKKPHLIWKHLNVFASSCNL